MNLTWENQAIDTLLLYGDKIINRYGAITVASDC